jgi:predicted permease
LFANVLLVAGQVATLFIMMGIGFALFRAGKLGKTATAQLAYLLVYVVIPCLIVDSLQIERDIDMLRSMGIALLANFAYYAIAMPASMLLFRRRPPGTRAVMRFGVIYANVGYMGFPLIEAVFGGEAMIYAVMTLAVFILFQWTHGIYLMEGKPRLSARSLLANPGIIGLVAGVALFLLDFRLPSPIGNAMSFVSSLNTPLAMIVIGAQIAQSDVKKALSSLRLYAACLIKLVLFPLAAALALLPFRLPAAIYAVTVVLCATPMAAQTSILAERYGRDTDTASQLVTMSTLLSLVTLPLFAGFL